MKTNIQLSRKVKTKKKVSPIVLGELISLVQHKLSPTADYTEITSVLKREFNLDITEDDVIRYFIPQICEIENELLYKEYEYDKNN